MFNWLRNIAGKARSIDTFANATVVRSETMRHRGTLDIESYRLVQSDAAYVALFTNRLAEDAARVKLRLMRPQGGRGPRRGERSTSKAMAKWLREGVRPFCSKAADISETSGDMVEVTDHPILDLLARPNPNQTGYAFRWHRHKLEGVVGESYVIAGDQSHQVLSFPGSGSRMKYLHSLLSQYTTPYSSKENLYEGYWSGRDRSDVQHFEPDEVRMSKWAEDIHRPLNGRPPHADFQQEQEVYLAVMQQTLATMDNQMSPNIVVSIDEPLSAPAREALERHLETKHRGVGNSGKPIIIDGGKGTVSTLSHPPKDLAAEEVIKERVVALAAAYKIPESEIRNNDANLATSMVGNRSYAMNAIGPRVGSEAEFWTNVLCEEVFGLDGWCIVPDPSFIPEDEAAKATTTTVLVGAGVMTQNEARQEFGLEPRDGGDSLRVNGVSVEALDKQATQPVGGGFGFPMLPPVSEPAPILALSAPESAPEAKEAPPAAKVQDAPQADPEPGSCSCCSDKSPTVVKMTDLWDAEPEYKAKSVDDAEDRSPYRKDLPETAKLYRSAREAQRAFWKGLDQRIEANPFGMKSHGGVQRVKDREADMIDAMLRAWLGVQDDQRLSSLLFVGGAADQFRKIVEYGVETGQQQLVQMGAAIESGESLPVIQRPEILEQLTQKQEEFRARMRSYDDTTAERIRGAIAASLEENETLGQLKNRLRGIVDDDKRAAMIARTETAYAQVEGRKSAFKANPNVRGKRFRIAPQACPFCEAMHKQYGGDKVIPMDQAFIPPGASITGTDGREMKNNLGMPIDVPVHPHCRCDLDIVIAGAA